MPHDQLTAADAREALAQLSSDLLLGPLTPEETLESPPADTYLTGILWPRGAPVDAGDDEGGLDVGGLEEVGSDYGVPGYRANRPCSIGITFAVPAGAAVRVSLGSTSRYVPDRATSRELASAGSDYGQSTSTVGSSPANSPTAPSDDAGTSIPRVWKRQHLDYSFEISIDETRPSWIVQDFVVSSGTAVNDRRLSVHVKRRVRPELLVFTVTLINEEIDVEGSGPRDARCLFQTEVVVSSIADGVGLIQPRSRRSLATDDDDVLVNRLLYRDLQEFAVGHSIAAVWPKESLHAAHEVRTAWLPHSVVSGTSPEGHASLSGFRAANPMVLSAEFLGNEANRAGVISGLLAFSECYSQWVVQTLESGITEFQGELLTAARGNLNRCKATAARISEGVTALQTNDSAWIAFTLANAAMDCQSRYPSKGDGARALVWRPFQLAFILLVIPSLIDPMREDRDCMDLLWFPTGGGKTEAYLALTAFLIFHRRLVSKERREHGGTDVLMRYTLRLLTVQQFQRAASLVSACEALRLGDARLGSARITLGLYVGADTSPNKMDAARLAIAEEHAGQQPKSTPRQLVRCPVCGGELHGTDHSADPLLPRVDIKCHNKSCATKGVPLPILTVDESIYTYPPSLLIGTIDKFAQIPRRTDMRRIFGLVGGQPPGLIIQDELHLISGPLGSMAGLYETIVDVLCTRDGVRPKVIGSTATIGQAAKQVRALFDRSVLQFPPPGFDAEDSFFAVRDSVGPDRLYIGIPTAGRSPKFALQAVIAALLQTASALRQYGKVTDEVIDTYWTCVAYFNSLRELGGATVLLQDDVPRQMQFLAARLGILQRELQIPVELSSRQSSRELPGLLQKLSSTLAQFADDPNEFPEPEDAVLASNMISVGVDVPRLGLIVVNGQPKSTAEYIQASSRVGRRYPGLVFVLYNFGRPRDLSHFEHFMDYHSALYRSVEATSVTPWAPRARDKALHAVVCSIVRHMVPGLTDDESAINFDSNGPLIASISKSILDRATRATDGIETVDTKVDIAAVVHEWARKANDARTGNGKLRYWQKKAPFGRTSPHLMYAAEEGASAGAIAWATPNSLREVEPSTGFILKRIPPRAGAA